MKIVHYLSASGKDIYQSWLQSLRDSAGRIAVMRRIDRILLGNFGACKFCRDGVWELKIDKGPGYRVYYAKYQNCIVLLLCGGDKSRQDRDIDLAIDYLKDFEAQGGFQDE